MGSVLLVPFLRLGIQHFFQVLLLFLMASSMAPNTLIKSLLFQRELPEWHFMVQRKLHKTPQPLVFKKKKIIIIILEESQQAGGKSGGGGRMRLKQKLDVCTLAAFQGVFRDVPLFES